MRRREFLRAAGGAAMAGAGLSAVGPFSRLHALLPRRPRAEPGERYVERWSWAMGQPVHLELFAPSDDAGYEAASAVFAELRRVEARLSLFDDASDLAELNRRAGRGPMRVDADLRAVLEAGVSLHRDTGGAFDMAVEPLMRAWGFHAPRRDAPAEAEIREARDAVRAARIVLDGSRAMLPSSHTLLDPGGIGVGYGLDRAAAVLRAHGIARALLDVSGDLIAIGTPPGEEGWLVEVVDSAEPGSVVARHRLRDAALATSSNAVSTVQYASVVRGHVMDPETGYPARALRQASVVAGTGVAADALSTAILVTGTRAPRAERAWTIRAPR